MEQKVNGWVWGNIGVFLMHSKGSMARWWSYVTGDDINKKERKKWWCRWNLVASRLMVKFNGVVWFIMAKLRLRHCWCGTREGGKVVQPLLRFGDERVLHGCNLCLRTSRGTTTFHNIFTTPLFWVVVDPSTYNFFLFHFFFTFVELTLQLVVKILWDFVVLVEECFYVFFFLLFIYLFIFIFCSVKKMMVKTFTAKVSIGSNSKVFVVKQEIWDWIYLHQGGFKWMERYTSYCLL